MKKDTTNNTKDKDLTPLSKEQRTTLKIGITGGIGSGKSTIAHLYEIMGYPVYYADSRAKELMNNDPIIKENLIATFGKTVYPNHLDRKALANIVFSDKEALNKLNKITHPAVERDFASWCEDQTSPIIFKEAAILFESGTNISVDQTICVTAPKILRIMRVMKRDKCSAEMVEERMANQWSDDKKTALSDYIISTDDYHLVTPQALQILESLKNYQI